MDINTFINLFADLLDDTDPATLTPATRFRDLSDWSSVTALSLIATVEEELGIKLRPDDIRQSTTIADLHTKVTASR